MANINIYKIEVVKQQFFLQKLSQSMDLIDTQIIDTTFRGENVPFGFTLYLSRPQEEKAVPWKWLLDVFHQETIFKDPSAKAVLLVEAIGEMYAITFGSSYFLVDKYCDKDFGFNFARKQVLCSIKTTAQMTPNSHRNKTISSYIGYDNLEFDSGESFAKIKAKADVGEDFLLFKPSIEMGSSIRLSIENDTLSTIANVICFIENTIDEEQECNKIPVFKQITDTETLAELDASLHAAIKEDSEVIAIPELDIIGVTEVFNNADNDYILSWGRKQEHITQLTKEALHDFCDKYQLNYVDVVLGIKVIRQKDGETIQRDSIYSLIDYTDDEHCCLLSKGKWYRYNTDYLAYLSDSLAEIDVVYEPNFDYSNRRQNEFLDERYEEERNHPEYKEMDDKKIREAIRRKYYRERSFNIWRESDGFDNYDRHFFETADSKYEAMDLYKEGTMFAVKIGRTSEKLCYAIDQSLTALKMYRLRRWKGLPVINAVGLWLILDKRNYLPSVDNGRIDINSLKMLMLKNRLDQWKKDVRLAGMKPVIYINYVIE